MNPTLILKIASALLVLLLVAVGVQWMLLPHGMMATSGITAGPAGMSSLRGDIGGLLLSSAAMAAIGLLGGNGTWLRAAALALFAVACGRTLSLVLDGFAPAGLAAILVEVTCVVVFMLTASRPGAPEAPPAAGD